MVRNEDERGQTEVVCRLYVGRKVMEMELLGRRKRERLKRKFLDVVKEGMGKIGMKDIENRTL